MAIQYHNFLTLTFTNTFFGNHQCSVLKLVPFGRTTHTYKNYELLEKKQRAQTTWYVKSSEEEKQNFSDILKGIPDLFFKIQPTDNYFFNYTELPFLKEGELFYFSNQKNHNQLHREEYVSAADVKKVHPLLFSVPLASNKIIEVFSASNELVFKAELTNASQKVQQVDLRAFEPGLYDLYIDGKQTESFFATDEEIQESTIGVIQLSLEKLLKNNQNQLGIAFSARSVYWQYSIVIPEKRKIEVLEISVKSNNGSYQGPEEGKLMNGQKATIFRSADVIPLQEHTNSTPNLLITYANDFSSTKNQMEQKLPCPGIEQFSGQLENKFIISSIVYF